MTVCAEDVRSGFSFGNLIFQEEAFDSFLLPLLWLLDELLMFDVV